jgi:hypothetical protein
MRDEIAVWRKSVTDANKLSQRYAEEAKEDESAMKAWRRRAVTADAIIKLLIKVSTGAQLGWSFDFEALRDPTYDQVLDYATELFKHES